MQCKYKIIYDVNKDAWNWRDSLKNPFMNSNWIDNIDDASDSSIAHRIVGLKKQPAEEILKPYLMLQKNSIDSKLNQFIQLAEKEFGDKFTDACLVLERITKRPMMSDKFTFYVTTFPRMPYFYEKCLIFMYDSTEGVWGMPIDGFLHEALHFQFTHYWRDNKDSLVSKLSMDEFDYLKEALTIVLDADLMPIITLPDMGYGSQLEFRQFLYKNWEQYHDFDKLVDYGLANMSHFYVKS